MDAQNFPPPASTISPRGQPLLSRPPEQQLMSSLPPGGPPSIFPRPPPHTGLIPRPGSDPHHPPQAGPGFVPRLPLLDGRPQLPFPPPLRSPLGPPPLGLRPLMGGMIAPPQRPPQQPPNDMASPENQKEVWFEHKMGEGKVYYSNPKNNQTTWERPQDAQIISPPGPGPNPNLPSPGGFPFHPPPQLPTPPSGGPSQLVPTRVWSEYHTPEGKLYFYNKITKQSVWERPSDVDLILPLPPEFSATGPPTTDQSGTSRDSAPQQSSETDQEEAADQGMDMDGVAVTEGESQEEHLHSPLLERQVVEESNVQQNIVSNSMPLFNHPPPPFMVPPMMMMRAPPPGMEFQPPLFRPPVQNPPLLTKPPGIDKPQTEVAEVEQKEEPKGPRPKSNVPIPGSPWSVVWTTDERSFFFNVTSRTSVWSLPKDLEGNPHVSKIMDNPPWARKRVGEVKPSSETKRLRLGSLPDDSEEEDNDASPAAVANETEPGLLSHEEEQKQAVAKSGKSLEERQKDFKEMLLEREVSAFSTWEKELPKFVFDPRYRLLVVKERKACFESFVCSRAEEERKEKKSKLKEKREQYKALLEAAKLHPKASFSEFASKYSRDERFKSIEKMKEREQLFSEHLSELKRRSKQKEGGQKQSTKHKAEKTKSDFLDMLGESEAITERSQWKKIKVLFEKDTRYRAVESSAQKEEWFNEFVGGLSSQSNVDQKRRERMQASLKEREREVQMSRSAQEKEWGRERDHLRKSEAIDDYKSFLVDMVRSANATWYDTKRLLRNDSRWRMFETLDIDEKEGLFREHVSNLSEKKRLWFRKLLEETPQISLTMPWKKARKLIKEDPRYKAFGDSDNGREREYDKFLRDAMISAKNDFKSLLKELKLINYKSKEMIDESGRHYTDIVDVLKNDKRYLVLECIADEREKMLKDYIDDLHKKGPPPPPTATHPSERLRKSALGPLVT
ncbi:transcription elongation regulator 1-like isoform X2 [Halichondria panicea]|uniref:transcription elongation regulator 1-like isoform X2 n=1 Tax=Halichondria panicea TaxID=6063 RepID=UPI00312BB3E0